MASFEDQEKAANIVKLQAEAKKLSNDDTRAGKESRSIVKKLNSDANTNYLKMISMAFAGINVLINWEELWSSFSETIKVVLSP